MNNPTYVDFSRDLSSADRGLAADLESRYLSGRSAAMLESTQVLHHYRGAHATLCYFMPRMESFADVTLHISKRIQTKKDIVDFCIASARCGLREEMSWWLTAGFPAHAPLFMGTALMMANKAEDIMGHPTWFAVMRREPRLINALGLLYFASLLGPSSWTTWNLLQAYAECGLRWTGDQRHHIRTGLKAIQDAARSKEDYDEISCRFIDEGIQRLSVDRSL